MFKRDIYYIFLIISFFVFEYVPQKQVISKETNINSHVCAMSQRLLLRNMSQTKFHLPAGLNVVYLKPLRMIQLKETYAVEYISKLPITSETSSGHKTGTYPARHKGRGWLSAEETNVARLLSVSLIPL